MEYDPTINPCQVDGNNILHVYTDGGYVCRRIVNAGYYFIEDIIEHGFKYVQEASAMHYSNVAMCVECWNKDNLGIHLLREI